DTILGRFNSYSETPFGDDNCHLRVHDDQEAAKGLRNASQLAGVSDQTRDHSSDSATRNTISSGSSRSANSSTPISPRTPSEVKVHGRNSSHSRASPVNRSPKNLHLKNSERLSPSSKMLLPSSRPLTIYKNGVQPQTDSISDQNLSTLPPLNSNGITGITAAGRGSPNIRANPLVNNNNNIRTGVESHRFNAAQRFRQMVCRNRQQASSLRTGNVQDS
ncbi:hypothetical protein FGIG_07997, partial [Fasciola gigantica]